MPNAHSTLIVGFPCRDLFFTPEEEGQPTPAFVRLLTKLQYDLGFEYPSKMYDMTEVYCYNDHFTRHQGIWKSTPVVLCYEAFDERWPTPGENLLFGFDLGKSCKPLRVVDAAHELEELVSGLSLGEMGSNIQLYSATWLL